MSTTPGAPHYGVAWKDRCTELGGYPGYGPRVSNFPPEWWGRCCLLVVAKPGDKYVFDHYTYLPVYYNLPTFGAAAWMSAAYEDGGKYTRWLAKGTDEVLGSVANAPAALLDAAKKIAHPNPFKLIAGLLNVPTWAVIAGVALIGLLLLKALGLNPLRRIL